MTLYDKQVSTGAFIGVLVWLFFVAGGIVGGLIWAIYLKFAFAGEVKSPTTVMVTSGFIISIIVVAVTLLMMGAFS